MAGRAGRLTLAGERVNVERLPTDTEGSLGKVALLEALAPLGEELAAPGVVGEARCTVPAGRQTSGGKVQ